MTPIEQTAKALDNYARRWMQLAEDISGSTSFAIGSSVYRRLAYYGSGGIWSGCGNTPDLDILVFDVPDIKRVADCARQRGLCITTVGTLYGKVNSLRLHDGHSNFQCDIIYGPDVYQRRLKMGILKQHIGLFYQTLFVSIDRV